MRQSGIGAVPADHFFTMEIDMLNLLANLAWLKLSLVRKVFKRLIFVVFLIITNTPCYIMCDKFFNIRRRRSPV